MNNIKPNQKRAKNAILLLWIMLTINIVSLLSHYLQYRLLSQIGNGISVSSTEAHLNDFREQIITWIYLITFLCTGVAFIKWFRRAYNNLHILGLSLYHSNGWAAGSWFVPILSLFRPVQIMNEIYSETDAILLKNNIDKSSNLTTKFISFWWTFWVILNI